MDPKYKLVTLLLDETHNLCEVGGIDTHKFWSYKLKDSAYNILVNI